MRALVYSSCAYSTFTCYLQGAQPEWDVRGVFRPTGKSWIKEENTGFLEFLDSADLLVGTINAAELQGRVQNHTQRVQMPGIVFQGYQPDTVWIPGITSPMKGGIIHSRLAAAGWLVGKSQADTVALFTATHYEAVGFFKAFGQEKARLLSNWAKYCKIDLSAAFEQWSEGGCFMHTPNHPLPQVLFDIAEVTLANFGITDHRSSSEVAAARTNLKDDLATGGVWPVYAEIAEYLGIAARPSQWRDPTKSGGLSFGVKEMVARSFAAFDAAPPERRAEMIDALGGEAAMARYAGESGGGYVVFGRAKFNDVATVTVTVGDANEVLIGTDGADRLAGGPGTDILQGGDDGVYHTEISAQVYRLYFTVFGRAPEAAGHQFWVQQVTLGERTLGEVAAAFVASSEFQTTYGSTDDPQFVTLLYNNVLGRDPSTVDQDFWVGRIEGGTPREQVVLLFSESPEHQAPSEGLFVEPR
jgi:hypothetical protein